jgi:hypothetical protein
MQGTLVDEREPPVIERKNNLKLTIGSDTHLGGFVGKDLIHNVTVFSTLCTPKWDLITEQGSEGFRLPNQTLRTAESVGASRVIVHLPAELDDTRVWEFGMAQYRGRKATPMQDDDLHYSWVPTSEALHYYEDLPKAALFKRSFEAACTHVTETRGWD